MSTRDPQPSDRGARGSAAAGADDSARTSRAERSDHHPANWLLLVPLLITLFPPLYNRIDPTLFAIPFFYWYQLGAILISVVITIAVYRMTRR